MALVLAGMGTVSAAEQPSAGTVAGVVRYVGRVPPPLIVIESGSEQKVLEVDAATKGLGFAVAFLDLPAKPSTEERPTVTVDQTGWMFRPPVVAVREGQAVRFTNSDGSNHNVRSGDDVAANRMNEMTVNNPYIHRFQSKADAASPVAITCDIHPWMIAWVYVFGHGHYAVSDAGGRFTISSVPAGKHRLRIRHPGAGLERDLDVDVRAGRDTTIEVSFDTPDLEPWKPKWPSLEEER